MVIEPFEDLLIIKVIKWKENYGVFMGLVVQQQVQLDLGNRLRGPITYY